METPSPCRRRVHGARALSSIDLNHAHFFPLLHLSFVIPDARCSTLSRPHRIPRSISSTIRSSSCSYSKGSHLLQKRALHNRP